MFYSYVDSILLFRYVDSILLSREEEKLCYKRNFITEVISPLEKYLNYVNRSVKAPRFIAKEQYLSKDEKEKYFDLLYKLYKNYDTYAIYSINSDDQNVVVLSFPKTYTKESVFESIREQIIEEYKNRESFWEEIYKLSRSFEVEEKNKIVNGNKNDAYEIKSISLISSALINAYHNLLEGVVNFDEFKKLYDESSYFGFIEIAFSDEKYVQGAYIKLSPQKRTNMLIGVKVFKNFLEEYVI